MYTRFAALLLVLVAAVSIAGCGSDSSDKSDSSKKSDTASSSTSSDGGGDTSGSSQSLKLMADGNNLKFDKTELTAKAGKVTLELTNPSSIPHNIGVKDESGKTIGTEGELVAGGDVSKTTVDLKAGTYEYYCSPHESSGMKGTLTVS